MRIRFNTLVGAVIGILLLAGSAFSAVDSGAASEGKETVATMVVKKGSVKVTHYGEAKAEDAKKGMHLFEGDKIVTGELARAAMLLHDGSMIKLNENTTMQLEIKVKNDKQNRLKVLLGHLWAKVKKQESDLEIETPSAVAAIKGTQFELLVKQEGTDLTVWDGQVGLRNAKGNVLVGVSQRSSAQKGKAPSEPEKVDLEKLDDWFNSVVDIPANKTLKTTIRDKDGKEHKLDIKYSKD